MDSNDFVSGATSTFAKDAQIKSAAAAGQETLGHIVAAELQVQLESREFAACVTTTSAVPIVNGLRGRRYPRRDLPW